MNDDGQEMMDVEGDEFAPTEEEIAAERDEEPDMMLHADMWDRFLAWVRAIQAPWESDTDEYRKGRAVEYFNHSMRCSQDLLRLKPTQQSYGRLKPTSHAYSFCKALCQGP